MLTCEKYEKLQQDEEKITDQDDTLQSSEERKTVEDGTLLKYLVVDTGPLIRNIKFDKLAEKIVTTHGVVGEIRDRSTRDRLTVLPFDIDTTIPSDDSVKFVQDFARKTGDIRSLSDTDISVIALTFELEKSLNGIEHLRLTPGNNVKVNQGFGDDNVTNLAGFYVPKKCRVDGSKSRTTSMCSSGEVTTDIADISEIAQQLDQCELDEDWTTVPRNNKSSQDQLGEYFNSDDGAEDSDDDEGEWITPSNIKDKKIETLKTVSVGCTTTDFAMQNVLLQIGLHVVSVDGLLIKYAKTYVLKCAACFTIVEDCSKLFCTKCGNKTLEKVAVTIDDQGVKWYQKLSKKPKSLRGVRYSLPKPKGGRGANMPYITEDQPDKKYKNVANIKNSVDVMSGDFAKSGAPFGATNVDTRAFRYHQTAGRRGNPNERSKHTGNRKKKKR